jgi:hypothetical protein
LHKHQIDDYLINNQILEGYTLAIIYSKIILVKKEFTGTLAYSAATFAPAPEPPFPLGAVDSIDDNY